MLLTLTGIAKYFGTRCIFKDVSLEVRPGSISLLVGANGAGKSTLLRLMAGLSRPSAGQVHCHVPERSLGYLGHATFVYPGLTALENLRFWSDVYGLPGQTASLEAVLERVELSRFAREKAGVFSRGMSQRLNLARLLLLEPSLWLLDEPATGLDVRSAALLRREATAARDRGAGIVWISHDLAADAPLAERVLEISARRLAYDGPAREYAVQAMQSAPAAPASPAVQAGEGSLLC